MFAQLLLKQKEVVIDVNAQTIDKEGGNALILAILKSNSATDAMILPLINLLLDKGAAVNPVEKFGNHPLKAAFAVKNTAIAMKLLEKGADPNVLDSDKKPLWTQCIENNFYELLQVMIDKGAKVFPKTSTLSNAIKNNVRIVKIMVQQMELAKVLVKNGVDLNAEMAHVNFI